MARDPVGPESYAPERSAERLAACVELLKNVPPRKIGPFAVPKILECPQLFDDNLVCSCVLRCCTARSGRCQSQEGISFLGQKHERKQGLSLELMSRE